MLGEPVASTFFEGQAEKFCTDNPGSSYVVVPFLVEEGATVDFFNQEDNHAVIVDKEDSYQELLDMYIKEVSKIKNLTKFCEDHGLSKNYHVLVGIKNGTVHKKFRPLLTKVLGILGYTVLEDHLFEVNKKVNPYKTQEETLTGEQDDGQGVTYNVRKHKK
jgi:hypothetical protein